ncbi:hypothetical protein COOONC_00244 [Cooperia oncophora]
MHYKPQLGDRVFMKMPREKALAGHPKLTIDWSGPFRVIECNLVRVQFDLLLKCPDEISDEPVKVVSKRKRGRKSKNSENDIFSAQVLVKKNICFRSKDEYDVADVMHFLHVGFRCDGQPFPAVEGRGSFPLDSCRCSRTTRVGQLLSVVPQPACDERIECVLDAARVPSDMRIMDKSYKVLTPKAIGFAYAFFRHRCLHVSIMAGTVPQEAPLRHSQLPGWPCDATRVIEYGWRIAKKLEWETIAQSVQNGQEHGRIVVVVPEVLHRIKFCHTSPNMAIFYYKSFREIRATNTAIFADDVGNVILVLPPREPADPYSWLQFVNALNLWLSCGAHVIVVNGPRAVEENSWDRLNAKTRSHINGYVDTYPSFLNQIHCLVPAEPGILSSTMACLKVGVVHNPDRWWPVEQAVEFFEFLRQSEGLREARRCKDSEKHEAERKSVGRKKRAVVWWAGDKGWPHL